MNGTVTPVNFTRTIFSNDDAYATSLVTVFIDTYTSEALAWHPSAIKQQIEEDFPGTVSRLCFDRLMAGITLLTTNYFYRRVSVFIEVCNVLSGDTFDPTEFDPADSAECAWGITEAMLIHPPDEPEPFSSEIRAYIGAVLNSEGFVSAPDVLRIGTHANLRENVGEVFTDDPSMFAAIYQTQNGKKAEIESLLRSNLNDLMDQLRNLRLENGNVENVLRRIPKFTA